MGEDRVRGADRPSNRERVLVARRSVRTGLIISFLALAALVRVWGLRFGLPHTECRPDESVIVGLAGQFWSGDLNPRFFRYPTFADVPDLDGLRGGLCPGSRARPLRRVVR